MAKKPKPPGELKDLAKFLNGNGYTLAFPFDDIRKPGYVGGVNDDGQEIIVDDGDCLAAVKPKPPGKIKLGNFAKSSGFSLKAFLSAFGGMFGLDVSFVQAKKVAVSFPRPFLNSRFITQIELESAISGLKGACLRKLTDQSNFIIVQTLETDALKYTFTLSRELDAEAKAKLSDALSGAVKGAEVKATVKFTSNKELDLTVDGVTVTVGYKVAKAIPLAIGPSKAVAVIVLEATEATRFLSNPKVLVGKLALG